MVIHPSVYDTVFESTLAGLVIWCSIHTDCSYQQMGTLYMLLMEPIVQIGNITGHMVKSRLINHNTTVYITILLDRKFTLLSLT